MTHDVREVREFIQDQDKFYISGHIHPDGDSIGSCFSLGLALEKIGKEVHVLLEPHHSKYNIIPGRHLIYDGSLEDGATLICVDCADLGRLPEKLHAFAKSSPNTVCIDHHISNTHFARYNLVDSECSSTCEMVYHFLSSFIDMDKDIAQAIYAGMVSDTGGFRHAGTSQDTLQVSARLIELGIPFTEIYTELLNLRTYTETKLLARILDACRRSDDARIIHVCVPLIMMKDLDGAPDASPIDLDGVVEYLLNIRRVRVALLVYEREPGKAKISLRSRRINVGAIAQKFGGGGHNLAAGASVDGDVYEIRDRALTLVEAAVKEWYSTV